jgi:hypothetical protein
VQQGWPSPPHSQRCVVGLHTLPATHALLVQHGCPAAPHGAHAPLRHTSDVGSSHVLPAQQGWLLAPHARQTPVAHVCLPPQRLPQLPQYMAVLSAASQPFAETRSQLPKPAVQALTPHDPPVQRCVATFGRAHARPQPPQWLVAVLVLVSQPFAATPSQSP